MDYQEDVENFMLAGEQDFPDFMGLESEQANLYMNLITEEFTETLEAFTNRDLVEVADGLLRIWYGSSWVWHPPWTFHSMLSGMKLRHPICLSSLMVK